MKQSIVFFLLITFIVLCKSTSLKEEIFLSTDMVVGRLISSGNWGSHMVPLITAVLNTKGPILEMGSGDFSTPLLHAICAITKRTLITFETDKKWLSYFTDLVSDWHKFFYIPLSEDGRSWNIVGNECRWSVVFVDQTPCVRRIVDVQRLKENTDIFVVHDTQLPEWQNHKDILETFKYRYTYKRYKIETMLLSDVIDVTNFF